MAVLDTAASNNPLGYVYFRKYDKNCNPSPNGGIGFGWAIENDYIKIVCSICHQNDRFVKKVARNIIIKRLFNENNEKYTVKLNKEFLSNMINENIKPKYLLKNVEFNLEDISNNFIINIIKSTILNKYL